RVLPRAPAFDLERREPRLAQHLPEGATGAALVCYCAARDEKAAVDATVQVLREAGLAPLEVESWGTRQDPLGPVDVEAEAALMDRALAENAVIVATMTTFTAEDDAAD
ncbi:MAG: hypothetical protein AAFU72_17025, partial [Pseudomonadota bacterium]